MPLVGPASAFQELEYRGKTSFAISPELPAGTVSSWGGKVESKPIDLRDEPTEWRIKGKYDIVVTFDNERIALIDCKVATNDMGDQNKELYWPQLEAFAFALENPVNGLGKVVSETGLMMWQVNGATGSSEKGYLFSTESKYLSTGRSSGRFSLLINQVILVLDGTMPEESKSCSFCKYVQKRENSIKDELKLKELWGME